jgi:predicted DsbA family dithiol-disulfide isomerase
MMNVMHVDIWSDVVCPWCYIGKRRFEIALDGIEVPGGATKAPIGATVVHRSFQLDPSRPLGQTQNRRQMLMTKYRLSAEQVEAMDARMEQLGAADGLEYRLRPEGVTGNTRQAHELVHLGRTHGIGDAVLERFFKAYFAEGRSVFDPESLVSLAQEAGLDPRTSRQALDEGTYTAAVAAEGDKARNLGANGVPFFVIDSRFGLSGAQSIEVFRNTLERAAAAVPEARRA